MTNKDAKNTVKVGDTKAVEKAAEVKENAAAKAPEVKAEVKAETKEAAKKAEKPAKAATKKTTGAKKTVKKAATKATKATKTTKTTKAKTTKAAKAAKAAATGTQMILEFGDASADISKIEDKIKEKFIAEGHRAGNIKSLQIYVKPQDGKAYYVINEGKFTGDINLF